MKNWSRRNLMWWCAVFFAAIAVGYLLYLAGPGGATLRSEAQRISRRYGSLPAIRGRIYDGNGTLLAWSERRYDLLLIPQNGTNRQRLEALQKSLPEVVQNGNWKLLNSERKTFLQPVVLKYDLSMAEVAMLEPFLQHYGELEISLRFERCRIAGEALEAAIGEVQRDASTAEREIGVSGWELEFDSLLQGMPGEYTVWIDRRSEWIEGTFELLSPARPGGDITLAFQLGDEDVESGAAAVAEPVDSEWSETELEMLETGEGDL